MSHVQQSILILTQGLSTSFCSCDHNLILILYLQCPIGSYRIVMTLDVDVVKNQNISIYTSLTPSSLLPFIVYHLVIQIVVNCEMQVPEIHHRILHSLSLLLPLLQSWKSEHDQAPLAMLNCFQLMI